MTGGGFGSLDSMNKTIKNNRGLVKKTSVYDRIKNYSSALRGKKVKLTDKKLSPEELENLRNKSIQSDSENSMIQIIKLLVVLGAIFAFLTILIDY